MISSPGGTSQGLSRSYTLIVLAIFVVSTPIMIWGTIGALRTNSNDPRQWLPSGFEETKQYDWLQHHFGNDEITVASWPGCTLQDERADQLAAALTADPENGYFQRAVTGRQVVRQLISPPLKVPPQEAIDRLRGTLIGADGQSTCVILTVSPRGVADRAGAIEHLRRVAESACGLRPDQLRLGGPTVDAATIDIESQRMLLELAGLSGLVALLITWIRLHSLRLTIIALVIAVYCTALAMSILYFTGGSMNLVMTMLPPLIFVLGVSSSIHLVNYYYDALLEYPDHVAPLIALQHGWRPCLLASGTTAIGFFSLAVSKIVPVKMFGIYASAGMCAGLGVILLLLPVALHVWPGAPRTDHLPQKHSLRQPRVDWLLDVLQRRYTSILLGFAVVTVITSVGLLSLRSTVKLQYRFGSESRILSDYRWLEEHLGPLVPMELVVHFDPNRSWTLTEELDRITGLEQWIRELPSVGAALSGADFAPEIPTGGSLRDLSTRSLWNKRADEVIAYLDRNGFWSSNEQHERLWRISIRTSALGDLDYGRFIDTLRTKIDPLIGKETGIHVTYTGVIPLIYKAQRELLNDLTKSFLLAFCLIAIVIMIVLRSVRAGLVAMIPNVFPVLVVFGMMGWLGVWIEIGSIMTASAAMGIAVDDTFHLLVWHRRGLGAELSRQDSVRYAVHRCAGAMIHTTLICAGALLVFTLSTFMPIVRFAWLMAALLMAALIGDLVLLPSLLVSSLGSVFRATSESVDAVSPDRR